VPERSRAPNIRPSKPKPPLDVIDGFLNVLALGCVAEADQILRSIERLLAAPLKPPAVPQRKVVHRHFEGDALSIRPFARESLLANDNCTIQSAVSKGDQVVRDSTL